MRDNVIQFPTRSDQDMHRDVSMSASKPMQDEERRRQRIRTRRQELVDKVQEAAAANRSFSSGADISYVARAMDRLFAEVRKRGKTATTFGVP